MPRPYVVRDTVDIIQSGISLLAEVLANGFDAWHRTTKADQEYWIQNLYQA